MVTECSTAKLDFQRLSGRQIAAGFDGGAITSDGGALLLREVEQRIEEEKVTATKFGFIRRKRRFWVKTHWKACRNLRSGSTKGG